jgi:hypothetical protein
MTPTNPTYPTSPTNPTISTTSTTSTNHDEDRLSEFLLESDVYIEDNGFTERVMNRLPPPRHASRWRRPILGATALLACLVGLLLLPGGAYLTDVLHQVASYRPTQSPLPLLLSLPLVHLAILLVVVGGTVAAAVHD